MKGMELVWTAHKVQDIILGLVLIKSNPLHLILEFLPVYS